MIRKILQIILPKDTAQAKARAYRRAIQEEAKIGSKLFGPVPEGTRREFFCLDEHTWIWHEEWTDSNSMHHVRTTRYDIRPQGIFKAQDGQPYQPLTKDETMHLLNAAYHYNQALDTELAPWLVAAAV
jgi:hypothetical protein